MLINDLISEINKLGSILKDEATKIDESIFLIPMISKEGQSSSLIEGKKLIFQIYHMM